MSITGRCLCGAVKFSFGDPPLGRRACWCRDCQYMAAGNASISAFFSTRTFRASGPIRAYERRSDAGNRIRHRFCAECGTQLFVDAVGHGDVMIVRVGALDDREIGGPQSTIWAGSAPSWSLIDPAVPHFSAGPAARE